MAMSEEKMKQIMKEAVKESLKDVLCITDDNPIDLPQMKRDLEDVKRDLTDVKLTMNLLVEATPQVALRKIEAQIVGAGTFEQDDAVIDGSRYTWTYMEHGDEKLAISCAHCALHYGIYLPTLSMEHEQHRDTAFFAMPQMLIPLALEVGLLKYHTVGHANYRGDQDIAVVFLRDFPASVNVEKVTQWRSFEMTNEALNRTTVGGATLTGAVQGSKCALSGDGTITFVANDGEDGDSGSLMFDTRLPPPNVPPIQLGVYMGYKRRIQQGEFRQRARICPLPRFDQLLRHAIVPQRPTAQNLKLLHGRTYFDILRNTHDDYEQGILHLVKKGQSSSFVETGIFVSRKEKTTVTRGAFGSQKKKASDTSSGGT